MTPMLLVFALDACALADHACRARDYEARAHEAGADHNTTVERLYLAHLEHLLDFDGRRDPRILCDARKVLAAARAATPTPPEMVPRLAKAATEAATREREAGVSCASPPSAAGRPSDPRKVATRGKTAASKASAAAGSTPPAPAHNDSLDLLAVPSARDGASTSTTANSRATSSTFDRNSPGMGHGPSPNDSNSASATKDPRLSLPSPARAGSHVLSTSGRSASPDSARPRDGRGLLVAGGLLFATATALGGAAVYGHMVREDLTQRERALAAYAGELGFTDTATLAARADLLENAGRAHRLMFGAGLASGITAGAALITLGLGGHRRALHRRVSIQPTLAGLLLLGRF